VIRRGGGSPVRLSPRMVTIVLAIGRDQKSNKATARELGITLHTLRSHLETICKRLGASGRSRDVIIAFYWRHRSQIDATKVA
jgi:DNA-binding CsgD family transcriptional regulator